MMRRMCEILCGLTLVAGCQARPATPTAGVPAAFPATAPAAIVPPAESDADRVARLTAEQAKSIEALLAAKASAAAANDAPTVGKPPRPAGVNPKPAPPKSADGFRAVPPIGSPIATATPDAVVAPPPAPPAASASPMVITPIMPTDPPPAPEAARPASPDDALDRRLSQKAQQSPRDLAAQFAAQLVHFLNDEKVPTADAMTGLDAEDRDVLTAVLDGLTNFRNGLRQGNNLMMNQKIRALVEMGDRLRARADLAILNACVCRTVGGYGNYDSITPLRLIAGAAAKSKLYYEIENATPRLNAANLWATKLSQDIVLFDVAGKQVFAWPTTSVTDVCRNRRRDFFIGQKFELPATLAAGQYTVKITLNDLVANRVSEASLPLTIVPLSGAVPVEPAGPPLPR